MLNHCNLNSPWVNWSIGIGNTVAGIGFAFSLITLFGAYYGMGVSILGTEASWGLFSGTGMSAFITLVLSSLILFLRQKQPTQKPIIDSQVAHEQATVPFLPDEELMPYAKKYGYKGNDIEEANDYLDSLSDELHIFLKYQFPIEKDYILFKKCSFDDTCFGLEANIKKLESLQKAQPDLTIDKLNRRFYHYVKSGKIEILRLFLRFGADPNFIVFSKEGREEIPLFCAIKKGRKDIVELLLDHGGTKLINYRIKSHGITPFCLALRCKKSEIAKLLLDCGADYLMRSPFDGMSTLHIAAEQGLIGIVREILKREEGFVGKTSLLLSVDGYHSTPLESAVRSNALGCVKLLLEKGGDLYSSQQKQRAAALTKDKEIIALLQPDRKAPLEVPALPEEVMLQIYSYLDVRYLKSVALVNRDGHRLGATVLVDRARRYGYEGHDIKEAKETLRILGKDLNAFLKDLKLTSRLMNLESCIEQVKSLHATQPKLLNEKLSTYAKNGNIEMLRLFLTLGADSNFRGSDGEPPLYHAIRNQRTKVVELLLKNGGEKLINHPFKERERRLTPIHLALLYKDSDIAKLLLKHELNLHLKTSEGNNALHLAAYNGLYDIVLLILQFEDESLLLSKNNEGLTPLHRAAEKNQINCVRLLLEWGADPDCQNDAGKTPKQLTYNENIIKLLDSKKTPLHYVAERGDKDLVVKWLEKGTSLRDAVGDTPLHDAVKSGHLDVVKLLLEHEKKSPKKRYKSSSLITLTNMHGETPLHLAAKNNHIEIVRYLLEKGADPTILDFHNKSPRELTNDAHIIALLQERMNSGS